MQCKDQQLRHGEEEYHTALMLYEYDEQIITAHAKIQQLESILLDTKKDCTMRNRPCNARMNSYGIVKKSTIQP